MRIVTSDSEVEELGTEIVDSQLTMVSDIVSTPGEEDAIVEAKRVSVAWLCFDKQKAYQKHGMNYVKCNQPRCGAEYKLSSSTSKNLSRHVVQKHPSLLPLRKKKAGPKQMTLSL